MNDNIKTLSRVSMALSFVMLCVVSEANANITHMDLQKAAKLLDKKHIATKPNGSLKTPLNSHKQDINHTKKRNTLDVMSVNLNDPTFQSLLKTMSQGNKSYKKRSRYIPCYQYGYSQLQHESKRYQRSITEASRKHGVNEHLIKSVITAESCFKIRARSHKGAQGLMQLMPATARRFGVRNSYNSHQNIEAGTRYLRWLLNRYNGNMKFALAGYNAGEGNVDRYGGIPPYKETREYVRRVMNVYKTLSEKKEALGYSSGLTKVAANTQKTRADYHRIWQQKQVKQQTLVQNTLPVSERRCLKSAPHHLTRQTRLKRSGHGGRIWRRYYNLQAGENLLHVMKKTGVHINAIKRMNNLASKPSVLAGHQLLVWECRA